MQATITRRQLVRGAAGLGALAVCAPVVAGGMAAPQAALADDAEPSVSVCESWTFDAGFYPTLSPETSNNYGFSYWGRTCYNTLVAYDDAGQITGELAQDWTVDETGCVYTFTLRPGVLFSDGEPLTADAVKTSFEHAIETLGMYNGSYGRLTMLIASMEAPAEDTFVLMLTQPYYAALNDLTMCNPLGIVSPRAFDGGDPLAACAQQTLGTGPYMYAGDFVDNTYTFVRNPNYWGEPPAVASFKVKVIDSNDSKVQALQAGEVDAIIGSQRVSYDGFASLAEMGYGFETLPGVTATRFLAFNLMAAPFNNETLRKAVAMAIDTDLLSANVFNGLELPAKTLFSREKPYCDVDVATYDCDVEAACALLDEAGIVDADGDGIRELDGVPLQTSLIYSQSFSSIDDAVLAMCGMLQQIGIQATPVGGDMMTWYGNMMTGEYGLCLYYTYGGAFDPSTPITNIDPAMGADPVAMQWASFLPEGGAEITELNACADEGRVQQIYASVLGAIAEQCLVVPITEEHELVVWNPQTIAGYEGYDSDPYYVRIDGIQLA